MAPTASQHPSNSRLLRSPQKTKAPRCNLPQSSTSDRNWQQSCQSVRERNSMMYNNELMADCHFLVGRGSRAERIPAHKYVLATGSSVFYAMFYGSLAEESSKDVEIPEVEPVAFLNLLM
eukprot:GHVO01035357.1.p1 GENE.GHVO01035357.1~~GHVO01035357.1.p1  ORF type:complete len:120 (+),score=16.45 GHVO01035357.1:118-477(+)